MFKTIINNKFVFYFSVLSLTSVLVSFSSAIFALNKVNQVLIIHFSHLIGIDKVGSVSAIYWLGVLSLFLVLINSFLSYYLESKDRFLGKFLAATNLFMAVLIFIFFFAIISIN
jgi:hypothetical protein